MQTTKVEDNPPKIKDEAQQDVYDKQLSEAPQEIAVKKEEASIKEEETTLAMLRKDAINELANVRLFHHVE